MYTSSSPLSRGLLIVLESHQMKTYINFLLSYSVWFGLQDDDAVNAEAFINKASFLVTNSSHEVLALQYKVENCVNMDM